MQANNMIFVKDPISGITTTAGFIVAQHQLNFIGGNSSIKNKKSKLKSGREGGPEGQEVVGGGVVLAMLAKVRVHPQLGFGG